MPKKFYTPWKLTIWLLIAAGFLLVAANYLFGNRVETFARAPFPISRRLINSANFICLTSKERSELVLRRADSNSAWEVVRPANAPANGEEVARLLDALSRTAVRDVITPREISMRALRMENFGLGEGAAESVVIAGETFNIELHIGLPTPAEDGVFVSVKGFDSIYVADFSLREAVRPQRERFSDSSLFGITDLDDFEGIALRRPEWGFMRLRRDGSNWCIEQPINARADLLAIRKLAEAIMKTRIEHFTETPPTVVNLEPTVQVQVWLRGQTGSLRVKLWRDEGKVYASTLDGGAIVEISGDLAQIASRPLGSFRDKYLFGQRTKITRLAAEVGGKRMFALAHDDAGTWMLTFPVADKADVDVVTRLADELLSLRAEHFEATEGTPREDGTKIVIAGDSMNTSLFLGAENRAWLGQEELIYRLPEDSLTLLGRIIEKPEILYGRTLFSLKESEIARVSVWRSGIIDPEIIERAEDGSWSTPSDSDAVEMANLPQWLHLLEKFEAEDVVAFCPGGLASMTNDLYGLSQPYAEIAIDATNGDALRRRLLIGASTEDGGRYAKLKAHDAILVLSHVTCAVLEKRIAKEKNAAGKNDSAPAKTNLDSNE